MVFKSCFFTACGITLVIADTGSDSLTMSVGTNGTIVQAKTGLQNGKEKKMCECKDDDMNVCQNSTNPTVTSGTVPQFGECSDQLQCIDSYGYISTSKEEGPICAEKLHCLQEVNTTATAPASICHTCMSCIAQNDAAEKQLATAKRFNCATICPKEILDTVKERNAAGVGIADSFEVTPPPSGSEDDQTGSGSDDDGPGTMKREEEEMKERGD
ncbi:unnamed protein product [Peronospora belbahrii]|uniref:Secreted protein n=1 Tax=Peronospora belbahrii TaxID=622444 RepID=A0ABN8CV14_9STRA|nr:unnamed protein product [Peronospora belbahrii]